MLKKMTALLLAIIMVCLLAACGTENRQANEAQPQTVTDSGNSNPPEESPEIENQTAEGDAEISVTLGKAINTLASDESALISKYAAEFEQKTYSDAESGLSVTYNLFLPAGYDESKAYPTVVFIADSSCAGNDVTRSLTQGLGALVWACDEWQSVYECIVVVPAYPTTILDDHGSYTTTEYVELTKRLIDHIAETYAVDTNRIYGTGQSMGCMTTLILAAEYPDLYAACMFVDGQWDISTLKGLESQTFVYFAAEDDENAYNGMQEVMSMFDGDNVVYTYKQWDGTWSPDDLSAAAEDLFDAGTSVNFISWKTGTIDASGGNMRGSAAYHMASFDYAYNSVAVMEWIFGQTK